MGKYDEVLQHLLRIPEEDKNYQFRVNQEKQKLLDGEMLEVDAVSAIGLTLSKEGNRASNLASLYKLVKEQEDLLDEALKKVHLFKRAIAEMVEEEYKTSGITSLKLAEGGLLFTQPEPCGVVKDKEAFRQWCLKEGLEHSMHLNPQTMNSMVKKRVLEDGAIEVNAETKEVTCGMDGVSVFFRPKLVLRKG